MPSSPRTPAQIATEIINFPIGGGNFQDMLLEASEDNITRRAYRALQDQDSDTKPAKNVDKARERFDELLSGLYNLESKQPLTAKERNGIHNSHMLVNLLVQDSLHQGGAMHDQEQNDLSSTFSEYAKDLEKVVPLLRELGSAMGIPVSTPNRFR